MLLRAHPEFLPPCLPTSMVIPLSPDWVFEVKHDGFRFVVRKTAPESVVFSRKGLDWAPRVPTMVEAMQGHHRWRVRDLRRRWDRRLRCAADGTGTGRLAAGVPLRVRPDRSRWLEPLSNLLGQAP